MRLALILAAVLLAQAPPSGPQISSATLTLNLGTHARVSFSTSTLLFADADPDLVAQVPGSPDTIAIMAKARTTRNAQVTLTVQSTDDLRSGTVTLPASLITWTAQGSGFVPGTMSMSSAQVVGTWTGSGVRSGSQSFFFRNAWTHPPGVYSLTLVYTISAP